MAEQKRNKTLLRKGDPVIVITGKDKGKRGKILQVADDGNALIIEKINMIKRHTKPTKDAPGGIVDKESAIHVSNVLYYDSAAKKGSRLGVKFLADGKKVRYSKASKEVVDA